MISYSARVLRAGLRKTLIVQLLLVTAAGIGAYLAYGSAAAVGTLYGGAVAVVVAVLLAWRVQRAGEIGGSDAQRGTVQLYLGAVERFVFVLLAIGLGIAVLKLAPLPMIAGFAVAQLGYLTKLPTRLAKNNTAE
jgi:ATP synthase protein I